VKHKFLVELLENTWTSQDHYRNRNRETVGKEVKDRLALDGWFHQDEGRTPRNGNRYQSDGRESGFVHFFFGRLGE
jgi:hypothetical protein